MNRLEDKLKITLPALLNSLFDGQVEESSIQIQDTRKEFEGDITLVVFPLTRLSRKSPEDTAKLIGEQVVAQFDWIENYNVVKGFLNLSVQPDYWLQFFREALINPKFGFAAEPSGKKVLVEYSSPNTNKPLHLGHLRNNFLGYSIAEILKANGHEVYKVQIINDRGIHICKSMLAWKRFGQGETPESSGLKGDHLVGKYYVEFDKRYKQEVKVLVDKGKSEDEAKKQAPLMMEAQEMLKKWEMGDPETRELWQKMNDWVYQGFAKTYKQMGVDFDKLYYESDTFLLGKDEVLEQLNSKSFYKEKDNSVWVDLSTEGLDPKLLLRGDGTSVYMTQDIGTAILRHRDFDADNYYYVVGNEQDYHFKVLAIVLQKMGYEWADGLAHLSYGMVDLPEGKMKSREGTVVDADDLMDEMKSTAEAISMELGKLDSMDDEEKDQLFNKIGMAALKYFILKVDPKKRMLFNPRESVDFNGNTGPFIQYTHARIQSILAKFSEVNQEVNVPVQLIQDLDLEVIKRLYQFPEVIVEAGQAKSPAVLANYLYELVKDFNHFYQNTPPIIKEENQDLQDFRLGLCQMTANVIRRGTALLGIDVPDKM